MQGSPSDFRYSMLCKFSHGSMSSKGSRSVGARTHVSMEDDGLVVSQDGKLGSGVAKKREGSWINRGLDATSALRWITRIGRLWLALS